MPDAGFGVKDELAAWTGSTDKLRDVVKWIAGSFGALGAVLIGTAPLSGLSKLEFGWGLILPFVFGAGALVAVGYVVWRSTSLLAPVGVTLSDVAVSPPFESLRELVAREPASFVGTWGRDVPSFVVNRETEYLALSALDAQVNQGTLPNTAKVKAAREKLVRRIGSLGEVSARVLAAAGFYDLSRRFADAKRALFIAAGAVVVGIVGFIISVGAAPSSDDSEGASNIPALISLTADGLKADGPLLGDGCPTPFKGVVVSGGNEGPWTVIVTDEHCTAGTITLTDNDAKVLLKYAQ